MVYMVFIIPMYTYVCMYVCSIYVWYLEMVSIMFIYGMIWYGMVGMHGSCMVCMYKWHLRFLYIMAFVYGKHVWFVCV